MIQRPASPGPYATSAEVREYAAKLEQHLSDREREISRLIADVAPDYVGYIRVVAGLPKVARNPLYSVTVTRTRVRAADALDAQSQVLTALADVEWDDASGRPRNFRRNTTVTAVKVSD